MRFAVVMAKSVSCFCVYELPRRIVEYHPKLILESPIIMDTKVGLDYVEQYAPGGYLFLMGLYNKTDPTTLNPLNVLTTYPMEMVQDYAKKGLTDKHPNVEIAHNYRGWFSWNEASEKFPETDWGPMLDLIEDHGIKASEIHTYIMEINGWVSILEMIGPVMSQATKLGIQTFAATEFLIESQKYKSDTQLSDDDKRLLKFLADGALYKQIEGEMGVSTDTINRRVKRLKEQLGANTPAHMVAMSLRSGIIT